MITFNDRPNLAVKFTNDLDELAGGLAGLKAERGTALYDSLVFSLYYFNGIKGQRALLLLSDGKDEGSRFSFEETLEYARRAGVTIYTIGLGDDAAHKKLAKLAEETGGRASCPEGVGAGADLRHDREGAALAVPDRLPVVQHHRLHRLPHRDAEGRPARGRGEDDPGLLPVAGRWAPAAARSAAVPVARVSRGVLGRGRPVRVRGSPTPRPIHRRSGPQPHQLAEHGPFRRRDPARARAVAPSAEPSAAAPSAAAYRSRPAPAAVPVARGSRGVLGRGRPARVRGSPAPRPIHRRSGPRRARAFAATPELR